MQTNSLDSQALPSGTHLHEFVIERVIGSGGFGITYLARDTSLNRSVVIKENLPSQFAWRETSTGTVRPRHETGSDIDDYDWSLKNFLREADTLASLDHPGIVRVLRKFEGNGTAYFVMPFVEGVTFDLLIGEHTGNGSPFEEAGLRGLLERVLDALDHLHQRGIYHRDIKPGNILITNEGLPVLIDFGSARQRLSERSMTVVESAGYTPFEQLQSRGNVGPWSDLYALGGTLEKALTGEAPPKAMDRMRNDPRTPLVNRPELLKRYSEAFLGHIDTALEVDEAKRWQKSAEWLNALHGVTTIKNPIANSEQSKNIDNPSPDLTPISQDKRKRIQVAAVVLLSLFFVVLFVKSLSDKKGTQDNAYTQTQTLASEVSDDVVKAQVREAEARAKEAEERAAKSEKLKVELERKIQAEEHAKLEDEKRKLAEQHARQAEGLYAGEQRDFEIAPGVKMTYCWCPPGDFLMGSPATEKGRYNDENQVRVTISKGFWMGKTEVTQAQWLAVMGSNPSDFRGTNLPVEHVSWNDVQEFLQKIDPVFAVADGCKTMLPTEAQWEYAAMAGQSWVYSGGDSLDDVAWHSSNSGSTVNPVGMKKANAWGLHDMSGNVWEWCRDWYDEKLSGGVDPAGAKSGPYRVYRGGSWYFNAYSCRVADRFSNDPSLTDSGVGFRVLRSSAP
jgi:formylglycine-generating enzyme required for sulfatase activity/predicted Ser/Thr protein kinase